MLNFQHRTVKIKMRKIDDHIFGTREPDKGSSTLSSRSLVVDEEVMRPAVNVSEFFSVL